LERISVPIGFSLDVQKPFPMALPATGEALLVTTILPGAV
jgi:hypothetical protein